jgi:hypothetical protein
MPEQTDYFDKFLAEKFQHIDESVQHIDQKVDENVKHIDQRVNEIDKKVDESIQHIDREVKKIDQKVDESIEDNRAFRAEIKADNKSTRHWILGSAITFFVGFIAAAIAIFFGFAQLQTSWIQTVISFVGKAAVK